MRWSYQKFCGGYVRADGRFTVMKPVAGQADRTWRLCKSECLLDGFVIGRELGQFNSLIEAQKAAEKGA